MLRKFKDKRVRVGRIEQMEKDVHLIGKSQYPLKSNKLT